MDRYTYEEFLAECTFAEEVGASTLSFHRLRSGWWLADLYNVSSIGPAPHIALRDALRSWLWNTRLDFEAPQSPKGVCEMASAVGHYVIEWPAQSAFIVRRFDNVDVAYAAFLALEDRVGDGDTEVAMATATSLERLNIDIFGNLEHLNHHEYVRGG